MVSCRPVMNAIFSLVPTPSAELISTGCFHACQEIAAAEAADIGQDAAGEGRCGPVADECDRAIRFVDVDAGIPVTYLLFRRQPFYARNYRRTCKAESAACHEAD